MQFTSFILGDKKMAENETVNLPFTYKHVALQIISQPRLNGVIQVYYDLKTHKFKTVSFPFYAKNKATLNPKRYWFIYEWDTIDELYISDNDLIIDSPEKDYDYIAWKNDPIAQKSNLSFKVYLIMTENIRMHLKDYLVKKMEKENMMQKWIAEYKSFLNSEN